ncbi:GNAT family N-acetyltransferase [Paenibacillus sp. IB182493]|uniref:GNAT family N-acetyltransferase n=2 Tax=Paenibacillus arenilitoris TaxID=2772299 RepID=A0A927H4B4_9BACL|nr:GNAT family N-acetyltransferase [Paenibacillus arenilitoris]
MERHAEAMFTQDSRKRLLGINEPWPGSPPAPRFFLGRTIDGEAVCRFRHDVPDPLAERIAALCADEAAVSDFRTMPMRADAYMELLQGERSTLGPCFLVPAAGTEPPSHAVRLARADSGLLRGGFEWLIDEIDYAQPCVAIVKDGRAVSVCRSVRVSPRAHEAGLETLEAYRGRGYAAAAAAGWAAAVRSTGGVPLYSTASDNLASQSVARKLGLAFYGLNFTVY